MKKSLLISFAIFIASFSFSQSSQEEVELLQAVFGMEKKAIVAEFVNPSDIQNEAFWQLYDEYETKRKELGKQRIELLVQYADQYTTLTSDKADAWTSKVIQLQQETDKLITTYYKKIRKATDGIVATQFYQIEYYILTAIRMQILEEVPFVEEY